MSADDQTSDAALTGRMAARAAQVAYGRPLVTNVLRGLLVEAMVDEALGPAWTWCSTDYASWDFEHAQGLRLEVKQSAARQTWSLAGAASAASFDIKARTGRWEGAEWVSSAGRAAHVYVFAHHPLTSDDADHRNERQWVFHVVATHRLPDTQRISLRGVQALALSCEFTELSAAVEAVRAGLAIVPSGSPNPFHPARSNPMKTLREETRGKARLRLLQTTEGYAGLVVTGGQTAPAIHGDDPNVVWSRLEATAGASGPRYFGYDGARARFLRGFPGGFRDPLFISEERNYKVKARDFLNQELPLERASAAVQADCAVAARAFGRTNLLSAFESARLGDVWKGGSGPDFLRAAAAFTAGEFASALQEMEAIVRPYGPPSWPMMTYLPFFWRPQAHMFLKPRVTLDYAERVGHSFAHVYAAGLKPEVYQSLLSLAEAAEASVADLEPRDRIDVQSYIWVVGAGEAVLVTPQGSSRGV